MSHELRIGGETFPCKPNLPAWQLMKLAKTEQKAQAGDVMAAMAGMYDFVMGVIDPDHAARFDAFMDTWDGDEDAFNDAIGELMESYAEPRPTERSKPSGSGPSPTGQPSRVVSLSRGTVSEAPTSSTDGASAAS